MDGLAREHEGQQESRDSGGRARRESRRPAPLEMAELEIAGLKAEWGRDHSSGLLSHLQQGSNPESGREREKNDGRGNAVWQSTTHLSRSHASHYSSLDPIDETSLHEDMQTLLGSLLVMCPLLCA